MTMDAEELRREEREKAQADERQKIAEEVQASATGLLEINNADLDVLEAKNEALEYHNKLLVRNGTMTQATADAEAKTRREDIRLRKIANAEQEKGIEGAKDLLNRTLGISDNWKSGILGSIMQSSKGLKGFGAGLKETFTLTNIMGSTMQKVVESTIAAVFALDDAGSSLAASTGQGKKYDNMIMDIHNSSRAVGVGIREAAAAIGALNSTMSNFSSMSKETQQRLASQTAAMEAFGIAGETSGNILHGLTAGLGMTGNEAAKVAEDITATALKLEIPPNQLASAYESALPSLMSWGREGPRIFGKLAAASKKLNVEMSTLINFGEQFDTFEGASSAVGKLNQLMGGDSLNAYEMMNVTLDERNRLLLESFSRSGMVWKDMSRNAKLAYQNAAGFRDMGEAAKFFEGGLSAFEAGQKAMNETTLSAEQLKEAQEAAISVSKKWDLFKQSFAVFVVPILDVLNSAVSGLLRLSDQFGGFLQKGIAAAAAIGMMVVGFKALAGGLGLVSVLMSGGGAILAGLGGFAMGGVAIAAGIAVITIAVLALGYAMKMIAEASTDMFSTMALVTPETSASVGDIVKHAKSYVELSFKDPSEDNFIQALKEARKLEQSGGGKSSGAGGEGKTVILKIGETAFASAVVKAFDKDKELKMQS